MSPMILEESQLRLLARFDTDSLQAVEHGFAALARGEAAMPPVMHLEVAEPRGDIDIKSALIAGLPFVAVKIGAGFFGNRLLGLPNSSAMMVAIDARTGRCAAVLLDNGYLTDVRTALAGAVAARHLARPGPLRVGVIGAGAQARYQVEALMIECRVASLAVFAPRAEQVADYCTDMRDRSGLEATACRSAREVVERSDLIVTTTNASDPILHGAWLRPGQHITATGSDLPGKRELDPDVLARAEVLVCDDVAQSGRLGELQGASAAVIGRAASLGDVVLSRAPGRTAAEQITVCDLSGLGVQDTAIANHALRGRPGKAASRPHDEQG